MINKLLPYLWLIFLTSWSLVALMPILDILVGTSFVHDLIAYFMVIEGFCEKVPEL